jgi:transposase-like protein
VEQDHRFIKKLVNPSLGFKSFHTARKTIIGYETMNIIRKGQIQGVSQGDIVASVKFIAGIFGVVA